MDDWKKMIIEGSGVGKKEERETGDKDGRREDRIEGRR